MLKELSRATLHQQLLLFAPNATGPLLLQVRAHSRSCQPGQLVMKLPTLRILSLLRHQQETTSLTGSVHPGSWRLGSRFPLSLTPPGHAACNGVTGQLMRTTPTPLKQRPPLFPHPKHHPLPKPASLPPTGGEADAGSQQEVGFPGPCGQGGNVSPRPSLGDEDQIPPSPRAIWCAGLGRAQETQLHFQELSLEVVTAEVCREPPLRISIPVLFIIANAQQQGIIFGNYYANMC